MKFEMVIFDLDGTLADTLEDIADAMNRVLTGEGLPAHPYESYRYFVGKGLRNLVRDALPREKRSEEYITRCYDLMVADYGRNCLNKTRLYDGVVEVVGRLRDHNIRLAVFSNKSDDLTKIIVEALIGSEYFTIILGAQSGMPHKPDPAGALLISRQVGIVPGNILYLGDTDIDMITANNAGMFAVGAAWGFRTKEELIGSGACEVISHPLELLDIMDI